MCSSTFPQPRSVLRRVSGFLAPGGWVAVKVPNGPAQRVKEHMRAWLTPGYRATIADNLVHVNHFSARSLAAALRAEGFTDVLVVAAVPEYPPAGAIDRLVRRAAFVPARTTPGGGAHAARFQSSSLWPPLISRPRARR